MKRLICCLLALAMLCASAAVLAENTEYAVTDVVFRDGWDTRDQNAVFYEIFVGSFSDSDGDGIGDLRGIINRMDYLNDGDPQSGLSLGVDGLWLTPIFLSPTYHKYDVTDYRTIDPQFGTIDDLRELIDLCHQRGVLLILDLPINHTGDRNRWYKNFLNAHLMHNPDNPYYDFYVWISAGDPTPAGRHFTKTSVPGLLVEANFADSMPEMNFDSEFVRQTCVDVAEYYLDLGVDGFRFDAAKYIYFRDNAASCDFWLWYIARLKEKHPDIYTVAEVWDSDSITDIYGAAMNCFNFTTSQANGLIAETAKAGNVNRYAAYLETRQKALSAIRPGAVNVPFIANHDTDRASGYLTVASGAMQVAANLYLLSPGSPFLYYGEEIGLRGSRGGAVTDANRRLAMRWDDGDTVTDPVGTTYDPDKQTPYGVAALRGSSSGIYTYYKRLLMIRRANPEIARGEIRALNFPDTKAGGYLCAWEGSTVAVLHNTTQRTITLDLAAASDLSFTQISAVIGMGTAVLDGTLLTLEGQTSAVLR